MFEKEWRASFEGHDIIVSNSWALPLSSEARLYIDGARVDESRAFFASGSSPVLRGAIAAEGKNHRVEVFMRSGALKVLAMIQVDAAWIGGDRF